MKVEFKYGKVYVTGKPKEYMQKIPTRRHRFKNGSGSCSFDMSDMYQFENNCTHLIIVDMTLNQVLKFKKEDVMPTIVKTPYLGSHIFVAELMPLYKSGRFELLGAKNG